MKRREILSLLHFLALSLPDVLIWNPATMLYGSLAPDTDNSSKVSARGKQQHHIHVNECDFG